MHKDADRVNPENASSVGESMNKALDNKPYVTSIEVRKKVIPLSYLRDPPVLNDEK